MSIRGMKHVHRRLGMLMACWLSGTLLACHAQRRLSDVGLGLTPQQAEGRKTYDAYCDRCHEAYSYSHKQWPPLNRIFRKSYMTATGLRSNEERACFIIRYA